MTADTALLSIDLQRDYLARPGLIPEAEVLVARAAAMLARARERSWLVIHVRTESDERATMPHRRERPEVIAGSDGAAPPEALAPHGAEPVIIKHFFDPFDRPELEAILRKASVTRLILMGVQSHACIRSAATSAYARGFAVEIAAEAVGSDDPAHGDLALDWLGRRHMPRRRFDLKADLEPWRHVDPTDRAATLFEIERTSEHDVAALGERLIEAQPGLAALTAPARAERLRDWHRTLSDRKQMWIDALVRDVAKPRRDAEGEVGYGLALLANVAMLVEAEAEAEAEVEVGPPHVARHPHGVVGLITPWNNPFALAIGKLAPALGFGNAALWKPALPGARIAGLLHDSLAAVGLGEFVGIASGGASVGRTVANCASVSALSITGSTIAGRQLIELGARRRIPVQAEMGGNNAAIVDASADLDAAARDLASAMFSFSGQRCTAIRRVIAVGDIYDEFADRLAAAIDALAIGDPADSATDLGPVISDAKRSQLQAVADAAVQSGGRSLCGTRDIGALVERGSWVAPTLIDRIDPDHAVASDEQFGPVAVLLHAARFEDALELHDRGELGLLGALYSTDPAHIVEFERTAKAGILSIGQARPPFAADGPFVGWKSSGFGPPEHGRWNRDFYSRVQAVYRSASLA